MNIVLKNFPNVTEKTQFDYNNFNDTKEEQVLDLLEDLTDFLYIKKISKEKNRKYVTETEFDTIFS